MSNLPVRIINKSNNPLPAYATEGSSGLDLMANLEAPVVLESLERAMIPTGIYIELPAGYEAQVRPRSGLAAKQGLTCLNSPGTVDADYRGELKVIIVNLSKESQTVRHGERIAQMVIQKVERIHWEEAAELSATTRNHGGFGHTGK